LILADCYFTYYLLLTTYNSSGSRGTKDVDMRKLEESFTAKAIADEKQTKEQLAALKKELRYAKRALNHPPKSLILSSKEP
jgi:hypothetical protein